MHHKRRRPKNRRAGCIFCKPNKANGAKSDAQGPRTGRGVQEMRACVGDREVADIMDGGH